MVSDQEILDAFDEVEGPYATATEISDIVGITRTGVYNRLEDLYQQGVLEKKQPVPQFVGWWRPGIDDIQS